jgi:hypothetical protein
MAQLTVEIVAIDPETRWLPLAEIAFLLNRTQSAFVFSILDNPSAATLERNTSDHVTTAEVYAFLDNVRTYHKGHHPYLAAVVERRLDGPTLGNLFSSFKMENAFGGGAVFSLYGVGPLLGNIPVSLYVAFELLSFAIRFLYGEGLIHDECRACVFDRKIDKRQMVDAMTGGKLCQPCTLALKSRLDADQELSVERALRLISRTALSEQPDAQMIALLEEVRGQIPKVFLCHSSRDKKFVERLARDLLDYGCGVWFDKWELSVGDNIVTQIADGLQESAFLGIVLSQGSVASGWVRREWTAKFMREVDRGHVNILPILLEDCDIPILLEPLKRADFRTAESYDDALGELVAAIRRKSPPPPNSVLQLTKHSLRSGFRS